MVSIGLAGALVLMILLLATTALSSDAKASDRQIASALAEAQLDLLTGQVGLKDSPERAAFWQATDGPYAGAPGTLTSNGTEFTLSYQLEFLRGPSGESVGGAANRICQVRLSVAWWEGEKGRPGYGTFVIHRTRVLRESDVRL